MEEAIESRKNLSGSDLLQGQVVLITGGSRGIGAATALLLARHGAAIGVNYHRGETPHAT
jgi:3-oxoacyl-[acyl-carrier protein] reductase